MTAMPEIKMPHPVDAELVHKFIDVYQSLNKSNLFLLADIYHNNIIFTDPVHQVKGLNALNDYFVHLYANVSEISFKIDNFFIAEQEAALYWQMHYCHNKLNRGQPISVTGHSHLRFRDGKVIYHHDYFDIGAMLYEQIPFFGGLVRLIKQRAGQ